MVSGLQRSGNLPAWGWEVKMCYQKYESIGKTSLTTRNRKSSFHSGCGGGRRPGQPSLRRGRMRTVDSGFKRRHGRGREGTSTRKFSFSIDGGGSGENRRRCRDSHRDLQGAPTRLNPNDPDRPLLRLSAAPQAAAPAVLGRARRPGPRARRSDVTHALTSPAAAASEAGLGAGGAEFD